MLSELTDTQVESRPCWEGAVTAKGGSCGSEPCCVAKLQLGCPWGSLVSTAKWIELIRGRSAGKT